MFFILLISDSDQSDQTLICKIYEKHYKQMLYTATRILGMERGEDAVHDVFVKLMEKFDGNIAILGDKPGRFFVIIVRNHSLNLLKHERLEIVPLEEELVDDDISMPRVNSPEDILLNNEAIEGLATLIRKLTPATRQVMEYKYIEGYSNIEIANMLNISQSAVSTRIDKARKRLKELFERGMIDNVY